MMLRSPARSIGNSYSSIIRNTACHKNRLKEGEKTHRSIVFHLNFSNSINIFRDTKYILCQVFLLSVILVSAN